MQVVSLSITKEQPEEITPMACVEKQSATTLTGPVPLSYRAHMYAMGPRCKQLHQGAQRHSRLYCGQECVGPRMICKMCEGQRTAMGVLC